MLQRPELAQLLVQLGADMAHEHIEPSTGPTTAAAHSVTGPSAFVAADGPPSAGAAGGGGGCNGDGAPVWPEELVLALAAYCEQAVTAPGEIVLHVFPFGGVRAGVEMVAQLSDGRWPSSESC